MKNTFLDLSKMDALTGALNRREMELQFADLLDVSQEDLYLIILDIDNFKQVNDTLGHSFGDIVLKDVVKKLNESVSDKDLVGRFGGDEFVLVVRTKDIDSLVKQIHHNLTFKVLCDIGEYFVNTSIGVVKCFKYGTTYRHFLAQADYAMYYCKEHGKSTYYIYDDALNSIRIKEIKVVKSFKNDSVILGNDMYLRPIQCDFKEEFNEYVLYYSSSLFVIEDASSKIVDILDKRNLLHVLAMEKTRKVFELAKYMKENKIDKKVLTFISENKEMYNYYLGFLTTLLQNNNIDPSMIKLALRIPKDERYRNQFCEFISHIKSLGFNVGVFALFGYDIPYRYLLNKDIDFFVLADELIQNFSSSGGIYDMFIGHLTEIMKCMNKYCYTHGLLTTDKKYFEGRGIDIYNITGSPIKVNEYLKGKR